MSRLGSWFRGTAPTQSADGPIVFKTAEEELQYILHATNAANLIVNDDIEGAEAGLSQHNTAFHQVALGVAKFLRSVLSFEQEDMKAAYDTLTEAENQSYYEHKKAQKGTSLYQSEIYPPGSEYAMSLAYAQIMIAVVGVLNESITESLKGFYKLRKAYITLETLKAAEDLYLQNRSRKSSAAKSESISGPSGRGTPDSNADLDKSAASQTKSSSPNDTDADLDFEDAKETPPLSRTPLSYQGHVTNPQLSTPPDSPLRTTAWGDDDEDMYKHPIDEFIHSGISLCYGLMQLVLSMVPPVFSKLLSIIGFMGDRKVAMKLLWRATKYENINGGVAALTVLSFYDNLAAFCDILPINEACDFDPSGRPQIRCEELLQLMQSRYPDSKLWNIEEARIKLLNKDIDGAIELLEKSSNSKMRQVTALCIFEKSMAALSGHKFELAADSFIECSKLNNWSHALYFYIIGTCYLELYRDQNGKDSAKANVYKEKATEFLKKAPLSAGKKRMMSKPLPFDRYVVRKLAKWEERAKAWDVDLVDAIGISPAEEMIYLWGCHKRMQESDLQQSLVAISWARTNDEKRYEDDLDEKAIHALLLAQVLTCQGKLSEARRVLETEILVHEKAKFKGGFKDDYTCPCAHYEMAVIAWAEKDSESFDKEEKIAECEQYLDKVARWETYVLDARIGLKVSTAQDTLRQYKTAKPR